MTGTMKKSEGGGALSQYEFAKKPEELSFLQFLYNDSTGEVLGRSASSWIKIIVFYIIYYACLAGFFTLMLLVFFQTLDDRKPTWQNEDGLIGSNPGMGFRPRPDEDHIESTLIWFRHGTINGNWDKWVERLGDFVKDYENETDYRGRHPQDDCGPLAAERPESNKNVPPERESICKINKDELLKVIISDFYKNFSNMIVRGIVPENTTLVFVMVGPAS